MVTIERFDEDALLELVRRADDLGVVSVYVNADQAEDPGLQGVAIDLKNRYRELQQRVTEEGLRERSRRLTGALEQLRSQLESLTGPAGAGRGRMLFAALGAGWSLQLESAMSVPTRVVLDDTPFIHPLLELLDEGRPAGVVLASAGQARLLEWRLGRLRPLVRMEQEEIQAPHERAGQIGGGPSGQYHTPMREQRQARQQDRAERFLDDVVSAAAGLAAERRWWRTMVSGGERWTEPAVAAFPEHLRGSVIGDRRVLGGLEEAPLAAAVTERLLQEYTEQNRRLVERVRDAAHGQRAALGLSEVAAALNQGRVAHLIYDPEVRYAGSLGTDGMLYAGDEMGPGGGAGTPEPRLTERLVEQALATGARVSPVEGAASGRLSEADGVAAFLRW
jgi:hypothetical protein